MSEVHVGCCGFPKAKNEYYRQFKTIELQFTFYRLPKLETVRKWRDEAPEDFIFTMKAFQGITHTYFTPTYRRSNLRWDKEKLKRLGHFKPTDEVREVWQRTLEIARILQPTVLVFQCPPNFKFSEENAQNLLEFFKSVKNGSFTCAVELRADWDKNWIRQHFSELNLIHCVDPFKELPLTDGLRYFRLHGAPPGEKMYRYQYTDDDLQHLKQIVKAGPEAETYCMFNNMTMGEDALRFREMLTERP